ncbi:hypothetical protein K474DRAFT_816346 [Panus rudis PR-1116 ss-1]|nr:hypothetical protein K474DRAFT_816346 [Panus rudis PR-1116 ss-1]
MSDTPTTSFSVRSMDHFSSSSLQAALNEEESLFPGASSSHVSPSPSSPFPPPIRPRVSRPSTAPTTPNSNSRPSTPSTNPNLPVPMFLHRKLSTRRERRESILSLTTEEELQSFAEIMSVSLRDDGTAPEQPQAPESFGIPIEDEDAVIDDILSFGDLMPPRVRPDRFSMSTSYTQSSRHTGSSSASEFDILDAYAENAYLSPNHSNFPQLQIPRGRVPSSDCDTPSLRSSVSNSSISSPTLSRTSSFQHFFPASPLSSSASSPLPTPVDGPPAGIGGLGLRGLDVIEENRHSEEFDPSYHPPRDPSTIRTFNRQVYNSRPQAGYNQYQYQDDGVPQEKAMMDNGWTYVRPSDVVWEPRTNPHASEMQDGNRLRMRAGSPETIIPEPASPVIQAKSTASLGQQSSKSSGSGSHHSGGGLGGLGRLFGKKSKSSHNDDVLKSPSSSTSDLADEKQRKKEVAKARREQLALELKRKDEARKAAELEARKNAKKPAPRDAGGMWDGVSVSVL